MGNKKKPQPQSSGSGPRPDLLKEVDKVRPSRVFGKKVRVPVRVQTAADLWLDMFMEFSAILLGSEHFQTHGIHNTGMVIPSAAMLADEALAKFQDRWPGVEI